MKITAENLQQEWDNIKNDMPSTMVELYNDVPTVQEFYNEDKTCKEAIDLFAEVANKFIGNEKPSNDDELAKQKAIAKMKMAKAKLALLKLKK